MIYSGLGGHAAVLFSLLDGGFMSCSKHHIVLAGTEPPLANYIERLEKLGIHWSYVRKPAGSGHFKFYISLYKEFVSQKPDLILLNGLSSIPAILLLKCRRIFKQPIVLLRETEPVQLKSRFEWTLLALAHILVDQIVHLSSEASQGSKDVLGILHRDKKVKIIPNGLDTNFYCPNIDKVKSDTILIGMVSRLHPKKDHTTLVVAFKKLTIARTDIQLHLHIAGEGETKLAIEQEINKNNLADNVTMHGLLDSTEIRDLLQQLDIYVHATFGETMSNSLMQAMATELPIVASAVNGVENMISSQYGTTFRSGDVDDLVENLIHYIDHPTEVSKLAIQARIRAKTDYEHHDFAEKYEKLSLELVRYN